MVIAVSEAPPNAPLPTEGRVLRLHFSCRAALPFGSYLRVTSSRLWAPDAGDVVDAGDQHGPDNKKQYASSVEMVTSPETYPVWRTRTPVVVVTNSDRGRLLESQAMLVSAVIVVIIVVVVTFGAVSHRLCPRHQ